VLGSTEIVGILPHDGCSNDQQLSWMDKSYRYSYTVNRPGFAKPVGTGPVRPVPGGTGPARFPPKNRAYKFAIPVNRPIFADSRKLVGGSFVNPEIDSLYNDLSFCPSVWHLIHLLTHKSWWSCAHLIFVVMLMLNWGIMPDTRQEGMQPLQPTWPLDFRKHSHCCW
jgi:hypothetical protein